jgi:hypothetical protein
MGCETLLSTTKTAPVLGRGSASCRKNCCRRANGVPNATILASHMDAINHMTLSRKELRDFVKQHGIQERVRIPADGETMKF